MSAPSEPVGSIPQEVVRLVKRIEIRARRLVNDVFLGEYHSVFKGRGIEFSEVREYLPGDDVRTIDWNVTARTGHPFVKKFVEERELTIMLLVDVSASGWFGSRQQTKSQVATEVCALLALSAISNNDKVGLVAFTDRIERFVPPQKGRLHALRIIRELLYLCPRNRGTNIAAALDYLNQIAKRRWVVFLVSDFLNRGYQASLRVANRRHDLIALTISDPREEELPPLGLIDLEDAETGERLTMDAGNTAFRNWYARQVALEKEERNRFFIANKVDRVALSTHRPYVTPLLTFFQERARKI